MHDWQVAGCEVYSESLKDRKKRSLARNDLEPYRGA